MSPIIIGILGLILFLIIIFTGMPVSFSMLFTGFWGLCILRSPTAAFDIISKDVFTNFSSYTFTVVPMFVFMGFVAYRSGIGQGLFKLSHKLIGHYRGGLALAAQLACALFGAICGSLAASVATIGTIAFPEMKRYNYADSLSASSIAAGASIGSLIPPSVLFIIYGIATEQSIGQLFLAGVLPGVLLTSLNMLTIALLCKFNPTLAPVSPKTPFHEAISEIRNGLVEILIVFIISLGGLFIGWFTPTEAGAVGSLSLLFITLLEKKLDWKNLKLAILDTTKLSAMIFLLVAGATVFGRFFALTRIPFELGSIVTQFHLAPGIVMAIIILLYLILGCFIDALALILLTIPIFYPLVVKTFGYDPIWFGVIILLCAVMGSITPPVGLNIYVMKSVAPSVKLETMFKGVWPFVGALIVCIALIIIFPGIATILPRLVYK